MLDDQRLVDTLDWILDERLKQKTKGRKGMVGYILFTKRVTLFHGY